MDLLSTLVKNSFPFTQDLLKDILIGIAAGVIQCPLAIGAFLIENNVPLNKVEFGLPKKAKETYQITAIANTFSVFHGFIERSILMPCFSSYAITGSALIESIIHMFSASEKSRLSHFASGLYLSGLTLFNQGNLIPSTVSEITKNTLSCFVQVPSSRK